MFTINKSWVGRAICIVSSIEQDLSQDYRGAYVTFLCRSSNIIDAARIISDELHENKLEIVGFEFLVDVDYLDRQLSDYEKDLYSLLDQYPVQFRNVHFFKLDA